MICSNVTGLKYIGSTTAYSLAHRLSDQVCKCGNYYDHGVGSYMTSYEILKGGRGTYYIELIENFPCTSKDELNKRMGEIVRATECVNKIIPGRTQAEFRLECPEQVKATAAKYYKKNFETISAKAKVSQKIYREENSEAIAAKAKAYNVANRAHLADKQRRRRAAARVYSAAVKELFAIQLD
eukprot:CAMPEP_0171710858 /NCGR_PEP_ID=MMETSP0991-20121206/16237_1 /TAXON_ID=483369 /ORGANISM="non described non described, Strain CCMP2098" /LENGTH=182 /DNA_ID=CAMNT_0012301063 /DNA_START=60 /DNA_END=608 /DNA_ORIENTATION=+